MPYRWSHLIAAALPGASIVMLVSGVFLWREEWLSPIVVPYLRVACLGAFAVLAAAAVGAASCMAAHAAAAQQLGREWRRVYVPAWIYAVIFAFAGGFGIEIGYYVVQGADLKAASMPDPSISVAVSVFLALGKIVFQFVLEGRKQVDRELENREAARIRDEATAREKEQAGAIPAARGGKSPGAYRKGFRTVGALGAAAALGVSGGAPAPVTYPTHTVETQQTANKTTPQARTATKTAARGDREVAKERARQMLAEGSLSDRAISRETGVPRSTLHRLKMASAAG